MGRTRVKKAAQAAVDTRQMALPGFDLGAPAGAALARARALGLVLAKEAGAYVRRAKRFAHGDHAAQLDTVVDALVEMACALGDVQGDTVVDGPLPAAPVPAAKEFLQAVAALEGQQVPPEVGRALAEGHTAAQALLAFAPDVAPGADHMLPVALAAEAPTPGAVHHHIAHDGAGRVLVRYRAGDALVGWALDAHRAGAVPPGLDLAGAQALAKRFDVDGGRATLPLTYPARVPAAPLAAHAQAWLGVEAEAFPVGEPGAGLVVKLADVQVERGLQLADARELFLTSPGGEFCGTLRLVKRRGGWQASLAKHAPIPAVLVPGAPMPPKGVSALPAALREAVPVALRYWLYDGAEARAVRDELVAMRKFTRENTRMVGGCYGVVEQRWFLAAPPAAPVVPTPARKASGPLQQAAAAVQACGVELGVEHARLRMVGPTLQALAKAADAIAVVEVRTPADAALVQRLPGDYIAVAADGPVTRAALATLGEPFAVREPSLVGLPGGLAFVTSLRVGQRDAATWLAKRYAPEGDTFLTHAQAWVESRGLLDDDSDYGGMLGHAVLRMAKLFSAEGHSGMSAQLARAYFNWVCDAWDGLHTLMLNDTDYAEAEAALAKAVQAVTKEAGLEDAGVVAAPGNPASKTIEYAGIKVRVDRPKGYIQRGEGPDGPWARTYACDYGYFPGTAGGDGEALDVFLGPDPTAGLAYWVRQVRPDGRFDEWKVMLGFPTELAARLAYAAHIPMRWYGGISAMPVDQLRALLGLEPAALAKAVHGDLSVAALQEGGGALLPGQVGFAPPLPAERAYRTVQVGKAEDERYVLGVVLEPETTDSQGDIYSAAEVRKAAFRFMEEYRNMGLQHEAIVTGKVLLLENYITKQAEVYGTEHVPAGTWMMAVRVVDDGLWADVKAGRLTGFSIGGSALKRPVH